MPEPNMLILFVLAALVLLITPGPAVLFVVTRTLQRGRTAGLLSTLGLSCGGLVHVAAAVFGLSAVLASSTSAFVAIKLLGAGYLLYLGFKTLLCSNDSGNNFADTPPKSLKRLFLDAFIVNVFNPKTAIFFLAFLPQFVNAKTNTIQLQLAILGILFVCLGMLTDGLYALLAASFRSWIVKSSLFRFQRYLSGSVYIGLGVSTAVTGRGSD